MTEINASQAVSDIARTGCLVWLNVSRPSLTVRLSAESLGLPQGLEAVASTPTVRPPGASYQNFSSLEQKARSALSKVAVSKGDGKFVPYALLDALVEEIEGIKAQYLAHAETYLETYDRDVAVALEAWTKEAHKIYDRLRRENSEFRENDRELFVDNLVEQVRRAWPKADSLRDKFGMNMRCLSFSIPGVGSDADASLVASAAKRMIDETLSGFTAEVLGELRARTAETMEGVLASLRGNSTFRENSLTPLRRFLDQFEALNVLGDDEVAARVRAVRSALGNGTALDVRTNEAFRERLESTLAEAVTIGQDLANQVSVDAQAMLSRRYGGGLRKVAV
jgi:hypothetical protein